MKTPWTYTRLPSNTIRCIRVAPGQGVAGPRWLILPPPILTPEEERERREQRP